MKRYLKYFAVLVVGASHSFFPLFGIASAQHTQLPLSSSSSKNLQEPNKMGGLPKVLASWERVDRMKDKMEIDMRSGVDSKDNYDFIVVGAGTSGSIVAARLAEHFSVLLLEAGGTPHTNHDNLAMSMIMTKHNETDWMYSSVVQNDSCLLCPDRKYVLSAGKGLGGSANLNYLDTMYEGAFQDYSEWMEVTQDPDWGYYMLQPYFKTVKEYMTKKHTISPGESRYCRSTYKALIQPTANLDVQKYSHVNKILFDDNVNQLQARGVEYERHGAVKKAFASKEVIISAGVFGSPKLLMVSGIGPSHVLNSSEIPVKMELPVGKNFHDHLAIPLGPFFKTLPGSQLVEEAPDAKQKFLDAWNSSGILRMPLINLKYSIYAKEMSHFLGTNGTALKEYMDAPQPLPPQRSKKSVLPITLDDSMFINVAIKKPVSRGEVTIAGKDPKLPPIINPNYLNAIYHDDTLAYSSEKQKLIEALEETVRLMETNPNVKTKFTQVSFPGCESYIFRGYGYWDCYIRHFSMSFNHGVGTCAMGTANSPTAVVDSKLKVRGVRSLRVIDASVIPTLVGTYPFLSVAVVGEKGAEMIIKKYKSVRKVEMLSPQNAHEEEDHSRQDLHQPFYGFRIKKLSWPAFSTTTNYNKPVIPFAISSLWKAADQLIAKSFGHEVDSSLSDSDLTPPGEQSTEKPNPSHFPVRPFAGRLIFHPLIPQQSQNVLNFTDYETRHVGLGK